MPSVTVTNIEENKPAVAPVLDEIRDAFDKIQERAFELFERRGGAPGFDAEDWFRAEHELFWVPQAELVEQESEFKIKVGVPGFGAQDLNITAQSGEVLVQGHAEKREQNTDKGVFYSEFSAGSLYRRFVLATPIDSGAVTANIEHGMLTVIAPKKKEETKVDTKEPARKIAVAA